MKLNRKSITKKIITTLLIILLMGCGVSFGVGYSRQINAWFYDIKVKVNGGYMQLSNEPFIYDGCIYVPLRDISNCLGFQLVWEDDTKIANLTGNGNMPYYNQYNNNVPNYNYNNPNYNNPNYNNPNYNYPYVVANKQSDRDIERKLNQDYEEYTEGTDDLKFEYDVSKESSYIKIKMEGQNFNKFSTEWKKRDDDDFKDFVEDIGEFAGDQLSDDVTIYVYDKNSKNIAKYEYNEGKNKLTTRYEYDDMSIDDIEDKLNDEYEEYTDGDYDLKFDYELTKHSDYIKVAMDGENFDRTSSRWNDRDDSDFRDFAEDIAEEIYDVIDDKDVRIYVEDEDGDKAAEYFYDESRDDFSKKYEY